MVHCIHCPARIHTLPDCLGCSIAWLSQSLSYSGSLDLRLWQPTCPWNLSASVASLVLLPVWTALLLLFKSLPTQQVKTDFSEPALPSSSTHVCYAYYQSDTDFASKSEQRVAFQILYIWTLFLPMIKHIVCLTFTISTLSACYVPFYLLQVYLGRTANYVLKILGQHGSKSQYSDRRNYSGQGKARIRVTHLNRNKWKPRWPQSSPVEF